MPSEGAPIQKINHIESSFCGLCKAVRNAIADSPTGRSLQSLYIAPTYICWVQIFALLFHSGYLVTEQLNDPTENISTFP